MKVLPIKLKLLHLRGRLVKGRSGEKILTCIMSTTRKQFDRNFKLKAVELSYQRSNIRTLADELGIRVALLYRWRREFATHQGASFAGNGKVVQTEAQSELARLKREL